jgi:hypothetical protein
MSTTSKLITLNRLLKKHGVPRKSTAMSKRFCRDVGIDILQAMPLGKGFSVVVNEQQGTDALNVWKEQEARKAAHKPRVCPDKGTCDRLEDRMLEHERLLNNLIAAQNLAAERQKIAADRLTTLVKQLCVARRGELIVVSRANDGTPYGTVVHSTNPEFPVGHLYDLTIYSFPKAWRLVTDCTIRLTAA